MSYPTKAILFSSICLFSTTAILTQESTGKKTTIEQEGVKVEMSITNPDGSPISSQNSPIKIIQNPQVAGQPNQLEFRFESPDGRNLFATANESDGEEPTTMRQIRMGDYATDGVLLAGDMWRSMDKWGVAGMLGRIKLATFERGQSLATFAESCQLEEDELRLLNPLVKFETLKSDTPVCVESNHRVLPGEDLRFLANLYQTSELTLMKLNQLEKDDSLEWRLIKVPAVTEKSRSGFSFYTVKYSPANPTTSFSRQDYVNRQHRVAAGQNLAAIAEMYETTVEDLRRLNGLTAEERLLVGQVITTKSEIKLEADINVAHLVNSLERVFGVRLEEIMALNKFKSPADFQAGDTIQIPVVDQK